MKPDPDPLPPSVMLAVKITYAAIMVAALIFLVGFVVANFGFALRDCYVAFGMPAWFNAVLLPASCVIIWEIIAGWTFRRPRK